MQGRSPAAAKLWPRCTARTLYDSYEKESTISLSSDVYQTSKLQSFHHLSIFVPLLRPRSPPVSHQLGAPCCCRGAGCGIVVDDAFSPMVSMPSVVDLDSGQVWPGRRCGRCVLAHVLDEVISGCKSIYKIYGYDIHGCRCTAYIYSICRYKWR